MTKHGMVCKVLTADTQHDMSDGKAFLLNKQTKKRAFYKTPSISSLNRPLQWFPRAGRVMVTSDRVFQGQPLYLFGFPNLLLCVNTGVHSCTWWKSGDNLWCRCPPSTCLSCFLLSTPGWLDCVLLCPQLHIGMLGLQGTRCHQGLHAFWGFELIPSQWHREHFTQWGTSSVQPWYLDKGSGCNGMCIH